MCTARKYAENSNIQQIFDITLKIHTWTLQYVPNMNFVVYLLFLTSVINVFWFMHYTDKKEYKIFLIYREIQSGAVAKSYMRKGILIYEEMRKYFPIYEEAASHIWLCNCSTLNFPIFFFISVLTRICVNFTHILQKRTEFCLNSSSNGQWNTLYLMWWIEVKSTYWTLQKKVSDIPAGDGKIVNLFLQCKLQKVVVNTRVRRLSGVV